MVKKFITLTILLISINCFADEIFNNTAITWNHIPINITLPIGKEKILKFPDSISLGIPEEIKDKLFMQNNSGWLYLTAKEPFIKTRIEIKDNTSGDIILLDLSADKSAGSEPLEITYTEKQSQTDTPNPLKGELSYVTLIRYAEQQLYAPERLKNNPYNIQLINSYVSKTGTIDKSAWFYSLFNDHSTINIKWAEWHGGDFYVTAVLVRNMQNASIDLTHALPLLCGRLDHTWNAVVFSPNWQLAKRGKKNDTAMAFLVSEKPFDEAVKNCGD